MSGDTDHREQPVIKHPAATVTDDPLSSKEVRPVLHLPPPRHARPRRRILALWIREFLILQATTSSQLNVLSR